MVISQHNTDLPPHDESIYTISELNSKAKFILEEEFKSIWLIGEISNLARPASGHLYFSLKDQFAQVRCALFKRVVKQLTFIPKNGQQVLVHATVSLYEARGDFQLIILKLELAGDGALQLAFEKLKTKLQNQGLFDPIHKKPLPSYVQTVGVITSKSGAAIRDVLHVLKRRCPCMNVIIYPTLVQGGDAKQHIIAAINTANTRQETDVLLLVRGGGSLEDLWTFNEESVAHAIFKSAIPIVTGIGHEVDFTIADFVADVRAPTPSAAAELISPDKAHWVFQLNQLFRQLTRNQQHTLERSQHHLHAFTKRLHHPSTSLNEVLKQLSHLKKRLNIALLHHLQQKKNQFQSGLTYLLQKNPHPQFIHLCSEYKSLGKRLIYISNHIYHDKTYQLNHISERLESISPLQTLKRGYAITTKLSDDSLIYNTDQVSLNEQVKIKLASGHLIAKIVKKANEIDKF